MNSATLIGLLALVSLSSAVSYTQGPIKGDADNEGGHVHEGIQLAARDGFLGVGETLEGNPKKVMVKRADNNGNTVWQTKVGQSANSGTAYSAGYSIIQDGVNSDKVYVGAGLWSKTGNKMEPAVMALDANTGNVLWTWRASGHAGHGGVRSVIMDNGRIICTGYINHGQSGFVFVADEAKAVVWELNTSGNLVKENILESQIPQGAKIRKVPSGGFVVASTAWGVIGGQDVEVAGLVKLKDNLDLEWEQTYGMQGGMTQVFDVLVDNNGDYLMGGHTTVGNGVVNWDYVALKVNGQTRNLEWRKTWGQPRGFDPQYIHDEMYGVDLDLAGNYLLLGGSGDEYSYSATNNDGWMSDIWVSYLVVVDPQGNTLFQGVFGDKEGNSAGEYLSVDQQTGEVMVYVDADTIGGGYGFMKLTPDSSNPSPTTAAPTTAAPTTAAPTTAAPTTAAPTTAAPTTAAPTTAAPTSTAAPTTTTTEGGSGEECEDIWSAQKCQRRKNRGKCNKNWVAKHCKYTCELCEEEQCKDNWSQEKCEMKLEEDKCENDWVAQNCLFTCGYCDDK